MRQPWINKVFFFFFFFFFKFFQKLTLASHNFAVSLFCSSPTPKLLSSI